MSSDDWPSSSAYERYRVSNSPSCPCGAGFAIEYNYFYYGKARHTVLEGYTCPSCNELFLVEKTAKEAAYREADEYKKKQKRREYRKRSTRRQIGYILDRRGEIVASPDERILAVALARDEGAPMEVVKNLAFGKAYTEAEYQWIMKARERIAVTGIEE